MIEHFEVEQLFADQVHERYQFKLKIKGNDHQGLFEDGRIKWFNPQPETIHEVESIAAIESQVHGLMRNHLQ
ncbi:DUF5342 domain-containing protein [Filibacter tadaridae]|uniref:Uncharacterized protein n=1 Tax=Filibacter tadaridae TaxID=2483811 RepID=A0A3P5X0U5_9BACL|nr:DUF5342 family protein [Filibacter tadaridae]VDC24216.1 hypothetical protein FILTAD_01030 [Filibacter tadaridae]